jgi:hypothetical protein
VLPALYPSPEMVTCAPGVVETSATGVSPAASRAYFGARPRCREMTDWNT